MKAARAEQSTIERAIELARTSSCVTLDDIRKTLRREGFDAIDQHLSGATIKRSLQDLIAARRRAEIGL